MQLIRHSSMQTILIKCWIFKNLRVILRGSFKIYPYVLKYLTVSVWDLWKCKFGFMKKVSHKQFWTNTYLPRIRFYVNTQKRELVETKNVEHDSDKRYFIKVAYTPLSFNSPFSMWVLIGCWITLYDHVFRTNMFIKGCYFKWNIVLIMLLYYVYFDCLYFSSNIHFLE